MDTAQLEADLKARIEQSKEWVAGDPEPVDGLKVRKFWALAMPVVFLDDPKRVERHGVGFDFSLLDSPKPLTVRLNVRIKPDATIAEKDDSPPYVVIYVVNQTTGADDAITWHKFFVADTYKDLEGLSIEDWYRNWLSSALVNKAAKKIFSPDMCMDGS
jgi:hypothetical protein